MNIYTTTSLSISLLLAAVAEAHMVSSGTSSTLKVTLYNYPGNPPTLNAGGNSSMTGGKPIFNSKATPGNPDSSGGIPYKVTIDKSASINISIGKMPTCADISGNANIPYSKNGKILSSIQLTLDNPSGMNVCHWQNSKY